MPAVTCPLETAVPGPTRRRVWKHPELRSHSLLLLTPDRLYLAPPGADPRPEVAAALEDGADPDGLLGPLATAVELSAVRRVRLDLLTNTLAIEYDSSGVGTGRLTVVFATPEVADACFTKVWRRLEGFVLQPYRRGAWALARTPLVVLGAVLAVTAALALTLSVFEDLATGRAAAVSVPVAGSLASPVDLPRSPLRALLGWLDWRVVCGVGGAAAAAVQVWLYRRLTQPPLSLELVRTGFP